MVVLLESITPVTTAGGRVFETTAMDVTELRRREEELQRAKEAAETASRREERLPRQHESRDTHPGRRMIGRLNLRFRDAATVPIGSSASTWRRGAGVGGCSGGGNRRNSRTFQRSSPGICG